MRKTFGACDRSRAIAINSRISSMNQSRNGWTYAQAGVDIDAGEALVERIKPLARATQRPGADASLGGFGALLDLKAAGYSDPLLVSTTDGVGTKLKVAIETGMHRGVGIDLVAMCVNDLLAQGAEPLVFLDYFATGRLDLDFAETVVAGIAEGCAMAGAALVGGETAEMPGMYAGSDYDLAGFSIGAVEREAVLPQLEQQRSGDVIIGLASSGPHSNGYSLIRRIVADSGLEWAAPAPFAPKMSLAEAMMAPTRIYVRSVLPLVRRGLLRGAAHITGGGLIQNTPRAVAKHLQPIFDWSSWSLPPVFTWLQEQGGVDLEEMRRTFNCGLGFLVIVPADTVVDVLGSLLDAGESAFVCGELRSA
jgi:phosphoribosylformylglycinamidine cyclo-ligase/phosphoribosylamine--glycine ligase/phosphoribosylglycinamide formyltransferase/phosphoribosylformylglycinamidine cyclo-ligase